MTVNQLLRAISVDPTQPPGTGGIQTIIGWVAWVATALGVVGIIVVGITMLFQNRRGEGGEAAGKLGWVLAGLVVITAASAIVGALT